MTSILIYLYWRGAQQCQNAGGLINTLWKVPETEELHNHAPRDPFHRVCSTDTVLNFLCSGSPPKIPVLRRQDRTALAMYPNGHVTCPTRATSSQGDREEGECADENHFCSPQTGHHRQSQQLEITKIQESMPLRIPSKDKIDSFL